MDEIEEEDEEEWDSEGSQTGEPTPAGTHWSRPAGTLRLDLAETSGTCLDLSGTRTPTGTLLVPIGPSQQNSAGSRPNTMRPAQDPTGGPQIGSGRTRLYLAITQDQRGTQSKLNPTRSQSNPEDQSQSQQSRTRPGPGSDTVTVVRVASAAEARPKLQKSLRFDDTPAEGLRAGPSPMPGLSVLPYERGLSPKPNITIPKRRYSMFRQESMAEIMNAPLFYENEGKVLKDGPSSQNTVLSLAGLLVCGLTLLSAALIVLWRQPQTMFTVVGIGFLVCGFGMLVTLGLLQRKNITKFLRDMRDDFNFLRADITASVAPVDAAAHNSVKY